MLNSANAARKPRKPLGTNETFWGYVFLAPVIIGFLVFTAVPVVVSLYYSLTNYDGITAPKFVGLSNYIDLFQNGEFGHALLNSVYFTIGTVPLGAFLALLVAILLNQKIKAQSLYRSAFFIPCIVSYVAIAMVWQWMYNQDYGLINSVLGALGLPQPGWLATEELAMPSVIIMTIWKGLGYNGVILLAGLQGISPSLYEAAEIDGASAFQRFTRITLPMIRPTMMFVLLTSMIGALQAFDQIYIMTSGGPGRATEVVCYLIYMNAFQYFKQGYASAMAYILFIIIFAASVIQLKVSEKNSEI